MKMKTQNKLLNQCLGQAFKSTFKFKHGAIIVYKNYIIGAGYNIKFTHPFILPYNQYKTLHAEMVALLRVKNKRLLRHSVMYIARINKHGELMLSKPCNTCMRIIKSFGLTDIYYTDNNTWNKL